MRKSVALFGAVAMLLSANSALSADYCATAEQKAKIAEFYGKMPGAMPPIASMRTGIGEAVVASGLPEGQAVSASGEHFAEIWAAMNSWSESTFLIMKGQNVFEIRSTVGKGGPSETSEYYNLKYDQPVRGHLRPDLYHSIYAIEMPGRGDAVVRGVMFFDQDGNSVFGVFASGDSITPTEADIANFNAVKELVASKGSVCQ